MATRRTIIDNITTAFVTEYGSEYVSNKFKSAETLVQGSSDGRSNFPFYNILLGAGSSELESMGGTIEDDIICPISIVAITSSQGEDLHLDIVDLLDSIINVLTNSTYVNTWHTNCWYISDIDWQPAEDEEYDEIGYLFVDVTCRSTES